jgi:hypothetical protein
MFKVPTVFVIGAGASKEAGLPLGTELIAAIQNVLDLRANDHGHKTGSGDILVWEAMWEVAEKQEKRFLALLDACAFIRRGAGLSFSIDNFIHQNGPDENLEFCAKAAIVSAILQSERKSRLFEREGAPLTSDLSHRLANSWYLTFFRMLGANVRRANLDTIFKDISIVCFNYDRCIEHFLYVALQDAYNLSKDEAAKLLGTLKIVHPYGSIGSLPWDQRSGAGSSPHRVSYGGSAKHKLVDLAANIKTFTEQNIDNTDLATVRNFIASGARIVFMGFGYYKQNMDLLSAAPMIKAKEYLGTTKGLSVSDQAVVARMLADRFAGSLKAQYLGREDRIPPLSCADFFNEYSRTLAEV